MLRHVLIAALTVLTLTSCVSCVSTVPTDVLSSHWDATVGIDKLISVESPFDMLRIKYGGATAVAIASTDDATYFLTAGHVAASPTPGDVVILMLDGHVMRVLKSRLDGLDLALLRCDKQPLTPVSVAQTTPDLGTPVYTIGDAALKGKRLFNGYISEKVDVAESGDVVSFNAPVIGGMSGGGVFYDGKLIGITVLSHLCAGHHIASFAPVERIREFLADTEVAELID